MPNHTVSFDEIMDQLRAQAQPDRLAGMAHYGINPDSALGVPVPSIRALAKGVRDHALAQRLWDSGIHEARLLASMLDDPAQVDEAQMERWAADFNSWDVVDQTCSNLLDRTPFAVKKAFEWSTRDEEFVKRAAFTLMATLAVHAKKMPDEAFLDFLPVIQRESADPRNFVKKAVNWALRQIGKRSPFLRQHAVQTALSIRENPSPAARWVANDALRELTGAKPSSAPVE